ncbi:MAG TPA: DNA-binding transcriptional regulator Fis [Gammaproteobacteria bacterium]|nr:DNA-binding transcriptional regulator Fis [Gammaproteobacteria bacterium]
MKDAAQRGTAARHADHVCLRDCTEQALEKYFNDLNGHGAEDVYAMVLGEIEPPLLKTALKYCRGNQSRAAALLGISRSTLRKKLQTYQINL